MSWLFRKPVPWWAAPGMLVATILLVDASKNSSYVWWAVIPLGLSCAMFGMWLKGAR